MRLTKPILLALTLLTATAHPQSPTDPTTLKVYSRETIVDTTVTDKSGNPVHGLLKPDFTLKEDNKPQPIRGFHEYATQPVPTPPKLPPNVYTNLQPPAPSSAINILLLDTLNTAPADDQNRFDLAAAADDQHWMKSEAAKYLRTMPSGTRVAVIGMSNTIRVLQGLTSDPQLLSEAVDSMDSNLHGVGMSTEQMCSQQDMRNKMTLESLNWIASYASGIKGKKNLIWLGRGIPTITEPEKRPPCLPDYNAELNKTYNSLTAEQVAVYPVALGIGIGIRTLSMEAVAEATGGVAYYNSNDVAGLVAKAVAKGSDYYTLTYVPPGTEYDGRHHTINLKLNLDPPPPGVHLTYRNGYYAEDPTKLVPTPGLILASTAPALKPGDKSFMGRSMPTSTDLLFDVQVEPTTEPAKPTDPPIMGTLDPKLAAQLTKNPKLLTRYSFEYVLPARQLTFAPTPEGNRKASLEFDIAVYDADDHLITSLGQSIKPILTSDQHQQLLKGPFRFFQQLDLPPGPLFLRIGILDATANKVGTLEIPLTVPKK